MSWRKVKLGDILHESKLESVNPLTDRRIRVRLNAKGVEKRPDIKEKEGATKQYIRRAGQFIYGKQNLHKGAFGIIPKELDGFETSSDIPAFDVSELCLSEWIEYYFKAGNFYLSLEKLARGVATKRISPKDFFEIEIPLPEINEQKTIISKFNKTEQKYDVLTTEITNQKTLLSKLKQSILQEAIQGKLTADWRKQNPELITGENSAEKLLERIKAEKEKLIKERGGKEKTLPPIKPEEIPFELPDGWVWCKLGKIVDDIKYGTSKKCDYNTERNSIVLRIPNVSSGILILDDLKYVDLDKKEKQDLTLIEDDILIIRSNGSKDLVGKAVIVDERCNGYCYAGYLIRLRFTKSLLFSKYIHRALTSDFIREQIEVPLRTTVGINNINSMEISNLIIPLPLFSEQKVIVYKVNALMEKCNKLEQQITQNKKDAGLLMQAVLKEAFEGKNDKF